MSRLEIKGASKAFPGVQALDAVDLTLEPGTIHALLGENGAGKSTLIKIMTGVHQPDDGVMQIDGQPVQFATPRDAIEAGIAVVHQERNLIPRFSVAENILLERLPVGAGGLIDYGDLNRSARKHMAPLGLDIDPQTPVRGLSVAQMQLVEIAKALSLDARILLLDEPTASITPHETLTLFALLRELRDSGVAIIFVSHKLEEVFELCDSVTVLRDGKNACQSRPLAGLDRSDVVRLMIGREERVVAARTSDADGAAVLALENIATDYGHRDINLEVRAGDIVGLYGLVGAGRTELAKAIIGAANVTGGSIKVDGSVAKIDSVSTALRRYGIGYVSEDRKHEGLILMHSVGRNVAITLWQRLSGLLGWLSGRGERQAVSPFVDRLQIRTPSLNQPTGLLSGGNQQKVSVAKWLAANARVLIIDEPTVGIDIQTKSYLHELIGELADQGCAILLISSDLPEMVTLADRILVMRDFRIVGAVANTHDLGSVSAEIMECIQN